MDCPQKNCIRQSPLEKWDLLSEGKSLFELDDDLGLPIGNLISQTTINYYLNEFDHLAKKLFKHYVRYVDDCVIIDKKENILKNISILRAQLLRDGVILHPNKFYLQHHTKGVNFVGSIIFKDRVYTHNRTINNAFRKMKMVNKIEINPRNVIKFRSIVNSYLGFMKNTQSFKIRKNFIETIDDK